VGYFDIAYHGLSQLHGPLDAIRDIVKFDLSRLPSLGRRARYPIAARNVPQSVEYLMQDEMLSLGLACVLAPLGFVV